MCLILVLLMELPVCIFYFVVMKFADIVAVIIEDKKIMIVF